MAKRPTCDREDGHIKKGGCALAKESCTSSCLEEPSVQEDKLQAGWKHECVLGNTQSIGEYHMLAEGTHEMKMPGSVQRRPPTETWKSKE